MKHLSFLALGAAALFAAAPAGAQSRSVSGAPPRATAPAPAAAADVRPQPAPPVTGTYQLGPGDKLNIVVLRDQQLSGPVQIRPDGKITMSLIGDIDAAGKTPTELRDTIAAALKEYMNNPVVTVVVVEATAAVAYVIGEVNNPGAVPLHNNLSVLQALALAGGLNEWANAKNVRILRKSATGAQQTITFNYKDAIKGNVAPVYLRAGDTIVVPD
jgi:polysaccharide export outer membrane protein